MVMDAKMNNFLICLNSFGQKSKEFKKNFNLLKGWLIRKYFLDAEVIHRKKFKNGCYILYKKLEIKVYNTLFTYTFSTKHKIENNFVHCLYVTKPKLQITEV